MAVHLGIGAGDLIGYPALAYPTYEVGAALAGAESLATDSLTALRPRTPAAAVDQQPGQPERPGAARSTHLRKVVDWCRERGTILVSDECYIECAWEGDAPALGARPAGQRRLPRRHPRGPLAVQALQPRRLPLRVRRRRPGPRRRAARGPQEPRPADARPAAARDDRRARRRRPRRASSTRGTPRAARSPARRPSRRPASASTTPRRRSTSGPPATRTAGRPSPTSPSRASSSRPASSTAAPGAEHVRVAFTATDERIDAAARRLARLSPTGGS